MRKLIFLFLLTGVFSCNNVAKYKDAINGLATDWDATTATVSGLIEKITAVQTQAKDLMTSMNPSEEAAAAMNEQQTATLNDLKQGLQANLGTLGEMSKTAFEFVSKWQSEGEKLTALKDGLAAGKLPKDVQATIDSLKATAEEGKSKVGEWEGGLENTQDMVQKAAAAYQQLMASIVAPATSSK
ncbi:MAG TPA: hypothetical protein PKA00_21765 [Saprospiraceae bacterium]|nr:hypothetical protein [Saprospiraceae bacterium]HMQ85554.1 hypothetical protein [Saprospiraceae bacterium]